MLKKLSTFWYYLWRQKRSEGRKLFLMIFDFWRSFWCSDFRRSDLWTFWSSLKKLSTVWPYDVLIFDVPSRRWRKLRKIVPGWKILLVGVDRRKSDRCWVPCWWCHNFHFSEKKITFLVTIETEIKLTFMGNVSYSFTRNSEVMKKYFVQCCHSLKIIFRPGFKVWCRLATVFSPKMFLFFFNLFLFLFVTNLTLSAMCCN